MSGRRVWDKPGSWFAEGLLMPLSFVCPETVRLEMRRPPAVVHDGVWLDDDLSEWEVRVAPDGTAYTYCCNKTGEFFDDDQLRLNELPPRSRDTTKGEG